MRIVIFIILQTLIFKIGISQRVEIEFQYDKVKMYDYEPRTEKGGSILDSNVKVTKGVVKEVVLDTKSSNKLYKFLRSKGSFNSRTSSCYDPHLGFVFYFKGEIIGCIDVCLSCNRLYSNFSINVPKRDAINEEKEVGLNKEFRKFLNRLLKHNEFSHQIIPGGIYDK